MNELIRKMIELRDKLHAELTAIVEKPASESRAALTEEERAAFEAKKAEIAEADERIAELQDEEKKAAAAAALRDRFPEIRITREPGTYDRGSGTSFFADVFRASTQGDYKAQERLQRHAREQHDELERRHVIAERMADELRERGEFRVGRRDIEFERRDVSRTDTTSAGEFVPPLWLIDEYAPLARAARVFADSFNVRPLPTGTDSINIPRVTTGGAVGVQTADNAAITSQDMVSATLSVPVRTIAGEMPIALQLLEQSPIAFDEVVFQDLIADYNAKLDVQCINGSGSSGQIQGLLGLSGINAVTYTDATPTVPELYPKVADAVNQAASGRKLPPTRLFMAPRRWYWHTAALDSQNRPLVVPMAQGPTNAFAGVSDVAAEGPVGVLQGLPVFIDANIPTNLGAGSDEDRVIASRFVDHWLWEGFLRTRVLAERKSGTLGVVLQLYSYAAATAGRYPAGSSVISGTGLITPTF